MACSVLAANLAAREAPRPIRVGQLSRRARWGHRWQLLAVACGCLVIAVAPHAKATTASDSASINVTSAELASLAAHPTWRRLLKADKRDDAQSAVTSPEYFISQDPHTTPIRELQLTLQAWPPTAGVEPDEHPHCRFPARYFWLSYELQRPQLRDYAACTRLLNWAKFDALESLSLIMVSGYFGNPASSFGHSLLRLNNGDGSGESSLLDLGINFGAQVPPKENTLLYILKGLFGGYSAGFSDKTFFEHDQTYSRLEFRDRWEYELALTDYEQTLLVLHLWELAGTKFQYFFLHQNCSFRLAELLELASGEDILSGVRIWYAPVSLFHDLRELKREDGTAWFTKVGFVPSAERTLTETLSGLTPDEHAAFLALLSAPEDKVAETSLSTARQAHVHSAALAYYNYRLASAKEADKPEIERQRADILRARLSLPPTVEVRTPATSLRPPSSRAAPSALDTGVGYIEGHGSYLSIGYAPFRYGGVGNNSLGNSSLIVADLQVGLNADDGLFLDHLDLIRARKITTQHGVIPERGGNSWEVAVGVRRQRNACLGCLEGFAEGRLGRSARVGSQVKLTAAMGARLSTRESHFELAPQLAAIFSPRAHWQMEVASEWFVARHSDRHQLNLNSVFAVSQTTELSLAAQFTEQANQVRLAFTRRM